MAVDQTIKKMHTPTMVGCMLSKALGGKAGGPPVAPPPVSGGPPSPAVDMLLSYWCRSRLFVDELGRRQVPDDIPGCRRSSRREEETTIEKIGLAGGLFLVPCGKHELQSRTGTTNPGWVACWMPLSMRLHPPKPRPSYDVEGP